MSPAGVDRTAVAMFSGGRGGASIARHLLRTPGTDLSLIINGYDNGLSTGALRRHLPGMLGPSDFRKNLLLHLDGGGPEQAALRTILRLRLPARGARGELEEIIAALGRDDPAGPFAALPRAVRAAVHRDLDGARRSLDERGYAAGGDGGPVLSPGLDLDGGPVLNPGLDLAGCSLGNLVFAGAYLRLRCDFNAAVRSCARTFGTPVRLVNVTNGENAYLVALEEHGRLVPDEAEIVAPGGRTRIAELYLLAAPLTARHGGELEHQPIGQVRRALGRLAATVTLNPQAKRAIEEADLIVYGPGTPHSSLLPSYLTPGVADAIAASRAAAKVFVVNIREDHDVPGLGPADLVDLTLAYLGDPRNERGHVTHVLCHRGVAPADVADLEHRTGARWVVADLEHPERQGVHSGRATGAALASIRNDSALVRLG